MYSPKIPFALLSVFSLTFSCFADDLIFAEDSEWEMVSEEHQFVEGMAWDADGHFFFTDVQAKQLFRIDKDTGEKTIVVEHTGRANGIAFGPDGRLYGCAKDSEGINVWDPNTWEVQTYGKGALSNDLTIRDDGIIFFSDPDTGSIWRLDVKSDKRNQAVTTKFRPNGIALSLDQSTLLVADFNTDTIHAHKLDETGQVTGDGWIGYRLAVPANGRGFLDGMQVLPDGRLLIGTALGIQLVTPYGQDTNNPATIVVPPPHDRPRCNYVRVSPNGQWIYACFAKDIRRRLINPGLLN